jgi:hypothetical protein
LPTARCSIYRSARAESKVENGNGQPLIVENEIVSLPSASTLALLRRQVNGRSPAPKLIAMLADPVFTATDERVKTASSQKVLSVKRKGHKPFHRVVQG